MTSKPMWIAIALLVVIGLFLATGRHNVPVTGGAGRYRLVRGNDQNLFIIDTTTGRCWNKFLNSNSRNSQWTDDSPKWAEP